MLDEALRARTTGRARGPDLSDEAPPRRSGKRVPEPEPEDTVTGARERSEAPPAGRSRGAARKTRAPAGDRPPAAGRGRKQTRKAPGAGSPVGAPVAAPGPEEAAPQAAPAAPRAGPAAPAGAWLQPWLQPRVLAATALGLLAGFLLHSGLGPGEAPEPAAEKPSVRQSGGPARPMSDRARPPAGGPLTATPYGTAQPPAEAYHPPWGDRPDLYRPREETRQAPAAPSGTQAWRGSGAAGFGERAFRGEAGQPRPWSGLDRPGERAPESGYAGFYPPAAGQTQPPGPGYDPWGAGATLPATSPGATWR